MINLIRLELKKFKIKGNILGALICNIVLLSFLCLIFFVESAEGKNTFDNYESLFKIMNALINPTFIVFAGFLICKFIIEEYKNKTIYLLFTYAISRKKIMISKVIIISVFTFLSIALSHILIFSNFYLIQSLTNTTIGELTTELISNQLITIGVSALTNSILCLIPLYFGLRKKSVPATITASFLISTFLYSGSAKFTLSSIVAIPVALMIAGIIMVYLIIRDMENKDVVL